MLKARQFLPVLLAFLVLPPAALGQQPLHWEANIDAAKATAGQSHRLVLLFFCANYCGYCHRLENELRDQAGASAALEANFVPVKVNSEFFPNTAKQYGISRLPTTVILAPTPRGEVLAVIPDYMPVEQYLTALSKVAVEVKRRNTAAFAQIQASPPVGSAAMAAQPPVGAVPGPAGSLPSPANPMVNPAPGPTTNPAVAMATGPALTANQPSGLTKPAESIKRPINPLFGLDGYCPVELVENSRWQPGKKAWGAIHRGRTYLFAGEDEQRRFLAHPDRYAPVSSGDDVVLLLEEGRSISGHREHGLKFDGHIFLFASESTLTRFLSNPHYYADRALQAMRLPTDNLTAR